MMLLYLANGFNFFNLINSLYQVDWVVFCKKPFKSPWHVVNYLGRYTHRVAINNSRIMDFDETTVTLKWKDYKDNKVKPMTLKVEEFVRRFLLHVLPSGFTKIRHYGILSSRNIGTKLVLCIKLADNKPIVPEKIVKFTLRCPLCGNIMVFAGITKSLSGP